MNEAPEPTSGSTVGSLAVVEETQTEGEEGKGDSNTTKKDECAAIAHGLAASVGVIDDPLAIQRLALKWGEVLVTIVGDDRGVWQHGLRRMPRVLRNGGRVFDLKVRRDRASEESGVDLFGGLGREHEGDGGNVQATKSACDTEDQEGVDTDGIAADGGERLVELDAIARLYLDGSGLEGTVDGPTAVVVKDANVIAKGVAVTSRRAL